MASHPTVEALAGASPSRRTLRAGGRDVPLLAGPGALAWLEPTLRETGFAGRLWVVGDRRALDLHGQQVAAHLPRAEVLAISGDEADKTLRAVEGVWDWLLERGAQRRDALVAFGGGVVCDLVGFAAACYLRGVGLVNVPTTLLAQVDASVGGKTGVNHARGKNLVGAFHQPLAVVADTTFLETLSPRALANGMAEVAKIAMAMDESLFARLEAAGAGWSTDADLLADAITRAIELKAGVVERDERESGERMLLNYGHTIGHALEAATGYGWLLHGEAVAIGMRAAAGLAVATRLLQPADAMRQAALLAALGLPTHARGVPAAAVLERLSLDKKREGERQRWVLPTRVGAAVIHDDVPDPLVRQAVADAVGNV